MNYATPGVIKIHPLKRAEITTCVLHVYLLSKWQACCKCVRNLVSPLHCPDITKEKRMRLHTKCTAWLVNKPILAKHWTHSQHQVQFDRYVNGTFQKEKQPSLPTKEQHRGPEWLTQNQISAETDRCSFRIWHTCNVNKWPLRITDAA